MADEPVKEEVISKQEEVLPLLPKEEVPPVREEIPQAKEETSEENEDLKIQSLVPKAGVKAELPPPKDDVPSAKEVGASVKEDVPSSKKSTDGDIAIAEEKPREDVPTIKEDVPTAKVDVPTAKEDVPAVKEDVPAAKEDVPTAKEDIPLETTVVSPKRAEPEVDIASDPEEDDLSDLDDVLDEFAATKIDSKAPAPSVPTVGPERPPPEELLATDQDEFAKQLQAEMEQLLGQEDFKKQFEDIMKEMGDVLPGASDSKEEASIPAKASASTSTSADKTEKSFQDTIRKTMERMQESGEQASAAAASSDGDDILAQMLKEMESGGFGGEGNDEDFSKILMGMMEQLTNKEVLYEPMKELNEKYPSWMEENKSKVPKDDLKRYEEQQTLVREIVGRFERKGYSDDNTQDREYIVERMQKMQAAGSPPPDLVGSMNAAQEALSEIDQGCPTQ